MPENMSSSVPVAPVVPTIAPGVMPAPKPKDHKIIKLLLILLLALVLIAGAAVIGYVLGQNNAPKATTTTTGDTKTTDTPAAQTPAETPAETPAQTPAETPVSANTKTYTNANYRNATFKYDDTKWSIAVGPDSTGGASTNVITMSNIAEPAKKLMITLIKSSLGMYTGNVEFYCGSKAKVLHAGEVVSNTSPDSTDYLQNGIVRVGVDVGSRAGIAFYGSNYYTVSDYDYYYETSNVEKIASGLCTDNGGVVSVVDNKVSAPTPQGDLTRMMASIPNTAGWTDAQFADADAIVASFTIAK